MRSNKGLGRAEARKLRLTEEVGKIDKGLGNPNSPHHARARAKERLGVTSARIKDPVVTVAMVDEVLVGVMQRTSGSARLRRKIVRRLRARLMAMVS